MRPPALGKFVPATNSTTTCHGVDRNDLEALNRCAELLGRFNRAAEAVPPTQAIGADHSDASLALLGVFGDSQALAHA